MFSRTNVNKGVNQSKHACKYFVVKTRTDLLNLNYGFVNQKENFIKEKVCIKLAISLLPTKRSLLAHLLYFYQQQQYNKTF